MTSSTVQFLVAGALVVAWAWMLGRPLITNLFRRSRRDSISHFRYQQAVLAGPDEPLPRRRWSWEDRPAPFAAWRAQPLEARRLQLLLSFAVADFVSLLLAIALRGLFIRLFVLMTLCFAAHLAFAVYVGSTQLRHQEEQARRRRLELGDQSMEGALPLAGLRAGEPEPGEGLLDDESPGDDLLDHAPEVRFPPLNIEARQDPVPPAAPPIETGDPEEGGASTAAAEHFDEDENELDGELGDSGATFVTAPRRRRGARRSKVRPVYIDSAEPTSDEDERAVND